MVADGKKWLRRKMEEKEIFVTKADKGGATLILDYENASYYIPIRTAEDYRATFFPINQSKECRFTRRSPDHRSNYI